MKNLNRPNLKSIKKSKEGKALAENVFYLTLLQVSNYIFPLITIPYLARVLGVAGVGKVAFASAVIVWIKTISDWGFNSTAVRDLSQKRKDKSAVEQIFSNVFWARCLLTLLSFIVLLILIIVLPTFRENATILLVSFLSVIGHVISFSFFFQGMEQMKYSTILGVFSKALFTIAVFVFVKDENDYLLQPLLSSLGTMIAGGIALYIIISQFKITILKPNGKEVIAAIKGSTDVFINTLMPNFYNNFSAILLGMYGGPSANGIYDAGKKLTNICNSILHAISRAFFPFLSRRSDKHTAFAWINIIIAGTCSLLIFIFAPQIIHLFYGEKFMDGVIVTKITSIALFFVIMDYVYAQNYLIANHYDRLVRNIAIIVSLIGFAIAFPLISNYGYVGAAITYTVSSVLIGGIPMVISIRMKNKNKKDNAA